MATLEIRVAALEQINSVHTEKKSINVFLIRHGEDVPVTRAEHADMIWYKRPDETIDDFEGRVAEDAEKLFPSPNVWRTFELWLKKIS